MGQFSGSTATQSFPVAVDGKIASFDVMGPEIALSLNAKQGTAASKQAQIWIYLAA